MALGTKWYGTRAHGYEMTINYGTPGWTLIVRVFIVVRNKKIVSNIFYFMVEKFEIKARFLIQG